MNRLITVLAAAIACCLLASCKDDNPTVIASKWIQAPPTIMSGDTMKVLRASGSERFVLQNSWRKYEMFNCDGGKMMSIGFYDVEQVDTMVEEAFGEWITVQEKRKRDEIGKKNWLAGFVVYSKDTVWVR